jgi:phosphate starvation-inducible PhoH-like protein
LNERIIELIDIAPKEFWGAQDTHLEMIKNIIQIKSCQRNNFKSFGEKEILDEFENVSTFNVTFYVLDNNVKSNVLLWGDSQEDKRCRLMIEFWFMV